MLITLIKEHSLLSVCFDILLGQTTQCQYASDIAMLMVYPEIFRPALLPSCVAKGFGNDNDTVAPKAQSNQLWAVRNIKFCKDAALPRQQASHLYELLLFDCMAANSWFPCLQCGGKLQQSLSGSAVDVFSKTLRGLAATKLTKPSAFRTADGAGYAVRCSYKVSVALWCFFSWPPLSMMWHIT